MKDQEPSPQQKRWNRHWNYRLEEDKLARAIFDGAAGKLTAKEALSCAEHVRLDMARDMCGIS